MGVINIVRTALPGWVAGRGAKLALLKRLCEDSPAVMISRRNVEGASSSAMLAVDDATLEILVDDILPAGDTPSVDIGESVHVVGELDGETVSFRSTVIARECSEGVDCLRLHRPWLVDQRRRRAHQRFPVTDASVPIYLVDLDANVVQGAVRDISRGGVRVELDVAVARSVRRGARLPTCTVMFGGLESFQGALEVRYVRRYAERPFICFGGRFLNLNRRQRSQLDAIVGALESRTVPELKAS